MKRLSITAIVVLGWIPATARPLFDTEMRMQISKGITLVKPTVGSGSGFFIQHKGKRFVLTNAHVCGDDKEIRLPFDTELEVTHPVIKTGNPETITDLCLIDASKVKNDDTINFKLAKSNEEPNENEHVFTGGQHSDFGVLFQVGQLNPVARIQGSVAYCSDNPDSDHCKKLIDSYYMTTSVIPGLSGSPYINEKLEVIGMAWGYENRYLRALVIPVKIIKEFLQ